MAEADLVSQRRVARARRAGRPVFSWAVQTPCGSRIATRGVFPGSTASCRTYVLPCERCDAIPSFAAAAVLILAIAIGANTAVYGVVRAIILDGLPFAQPDGWSGLPTTFPGAPASLGLSVVTTRADVWREWQQTHDVV